MSDGVFDVVEGQLENMELAVPAAAQGFLETRPVFDSAEALVQPHPLISALNRAVSGMGVNPVLERIHLGNPGKNVHNPLQVLPPGTLEVFLPAVEHLQVLSPQQLHAHGSHFTEFNRSVAVVVERLLPGREHVKGMPCLVQQRADIAVDPHRVHEDEGQAGFFQGGLVASRGLALAAVQVEQSVAAHGIQEFGETGLHPAGDFHAAIHQLPGLGKGPQRRPSSGIDAQVPGTQGLQTHLFGSHPLQLAGQGHNHRFDSLVKPIAVLRAVVESLQAAEHVVPIGIETRVGGNRRTYSQQLFKQLLQMVPLFQTAFDNRLPGRFPPAPLRILQVALHLLQGPVSALEGHRQGPYQLLVALGSLGLPGLQGDIGLAEQVHVILQAAVQDGITPGWELFPGRRPQETALETIFGGLEIFRNLLQKVKIGLFDLRILGVAGHPDVAQRALFPHGVAQLAPVQQPLFKSFDGIQLPFFQGPEERLQAAPMSIVEGFGKIAPLNMMGQSGQRVHGELRFRGRMSLRFNPGNSRRRSARELQRT